MGETLKGELVSWMSGLASPKEAPRCHQTRPTGRNCSYARPVSHIHITKQPSQQSAPYFSRCISCMACPHVSTSILPLPLDASQYRGNITFTPRCVPITKILAIGTKDNSECELLGMKAFAIVPIGDVDTLVASDGMRINDLGRMDAMLPLFLHFGMHHQERIMRKVYGNLSFSVCPQSILLRFIGLCVLISGNNFPNSKFSCNSKA